MRRAARVDANQEVIIAALRKIGASVQPLHTVGDGCPDLLVGWRGVNSLLEVKDGKQPPSKRRLNALQTSWRDSWRGSVHKVESVQDALEAILDRFGR